MGSRVHIKQFVENILKKMMYLYMLYAYNTIKTWKQKIYQVHM